MLLLVLPLVVAVAGAGPRPGAPRGPAMRGPDRLYIGEGKVREDGGSLRSHRPPVVVVVVGWARATQAVVVVTTNAKATAARTRTYRTRGICPPSWWP